MLHLHACFDGVALTVPGLLLVQLEGVLVLAKAESGMAQHRYGQFIRTKYGDVGVVGVVGVGVIPQEAAVEQVGFGYAAVACNGVAQGYIGRVALLAVTGRVEGDPTVEASALALDAHCAVVDTEHGVVALVPVVVKPAREVKKIVLAAHCCVHAKRGGIEQVVFHVAGVLGVEVVEGFVLFEGSADAKTGLLAHKTVSDLVAAEVALGKA